MDNEALIEAIKNAMLAVETGGDTTFADFVHFAEIGHELPKVIRAILPLIEAREAAAFRAGELAMRERAAKVGYGRLHPHLNHPQSDWTEFAHQQAESAESVAEVIRALEPTGGEHGAD